MTAIQQNRAIEGVSTRRRLAIILTLALGCITSVAWAVRARARAEAPKLAASGPGAEAEPEAAAAPSQSGGAGQPVKFNQVIRAWMWGDYIYPRTVIARPGPTLISLENETQIDVTLVVEQVRGASTPASLRLGTAEKARHTTTVYNLTPGAYVFYDADRPTMKGTIVVNPK